MNWFVPAQKADHSSPVATKSHWEVVVGAPVRQRHGSCSPRVAPPVIVSIQDWTAVTRKVQRFAIKMGSDVRSVHV